MSAFLKERTDNRQIFPFPEEGERVEETPPCLSWLTQETPCVVTVWIKDENGNPVWQGKTEKNYIVPDRILPAGVYHWNVEISQGERRGEQSFIITDTAVPFLRPNAREVFDCVPQERPRHLFSKQDLESLRGRKTELETLRRTVAVAMHDPLPERPMFHLNETALPYREYFGRFRDFCDRDLVALSLAYVLLEDEAAGWRAKELLLTICDWSPNGPCSLNGPWGDEVGLSMARCLPSVFDLLYPLLSEKERSWVAEVIFCYAQQCDIRLRKLDYCRNPGDSHAGRIPAYMGEAALVLKGTGVCPDEILLDWLERALEIYGGIFPYYGTPDGGWAEGPFYASSYTKWYLPFFSAVRRFSGADFLCRPFYRHVTRFFLHFADPDHENHPFGDGYWCHSEDPEWPGFFAQNPMRVYAARFGPEAARKMSRRCEASIGIYQLHLLDVFLPDGPVYEGEKAEDHALAVFPDAGFVSLHTNFGGRDDLHLLARASRFGSDSHRYPDQGSFALFWNGLALVSPSGYFGRKCGSVHHRLWTNSTRAHNALLIDGEGQYPYSRLAAGKIVSARQTEDGGVVVLNLSGAYPNGAHWQRTLELHQNRLDIFDHVESEKPCSVSFPLHMLACPQVQGDDLLLKRPGVRMRVHPKAGSLSGLTVCDTFAVDLNEGEPEAYHVTMPPQFHALWQTSETKCVHDLHVVIMICADTENKES